MSTKHWIELVFAAAILAAWLAPRGRKIARAFSNAINDIDRANQR